MCQKKNGVGAVSAIVFCVLCCADVISATIFFWFVSANNLFIKAIDCSNPLNFCFHTFEVN